jgi:hypothetical protein
LLVKHERKKTDKKEKQKEKNREKCKKWYSMLTEEEKQKKMKRNQEAKKKRLSKLTAEENEEKKKRNREAKKKRLSKLTAEEIEEKKKWNREKCNKWYSMLTAEEIEEKKKRNQEAQKKRLSKLTAEKIEEKKKRNREAQKKHLSKLTAEEIEEKKNRAREYIAKLVRENGPVTTYLDLALELLVANPIKDQLQCIMEILAGVPKLSHVLLSKLAQQNHYNEDVREMVAQIIAVVVCQSYNTFQIDGLIHDLCSNLKEKPLEQQYRSILTLGYTVGRIVRSHLSGTADRKELEKNCREQLLPRLSTATSLVIDFLFNSSHPMTLSAACLSVGEMGRCGPLLDSTGNSSRAVEKLLSVYDDVNIDSKIRENAALAAGYLSLGELEYPRRKHVIEHFLTSTEVSNPF